MRSRTYGGNRMQIRCLICRLGTDENNRSAIDDLAEQRRFEQQVGEVWD